MVPPINIAEIPEVPDLLLKRARSLASRLPDPCEGSRGHLAMEDVRAFEMDLELIRTDPTNVLLKWGDGSYCTMEELITHMSSFILNHTED